MLADVVPYLQCPLCAGDLAVAGTTLRCSAGHAFDIARQGYANLLTGRANLGTADTLEMVAARADFLGGGHFAPLSELIAERAAALDQGEGCVLDAGAGTGHYLAAVLDRLPGRPGVALDISKHALRRAARAHSRIGALAWDVWRPLPVRTGAVSVLIDVFAPRSGAEFHRVLRPGGALIVVTPAAHHLGELVGRLGLISVDERKADRVAESVGERFALAGAWSLEVPLSLTRSEVLSLVGMGPSARHTEPAVLRARVADLAEPVRVTAAFEVRAFEAREAAAFDVRSKS
ncbi:methyltransferase domain-containing protein [Actinoallomurus spadix]|uniref:Methyltransferase domain-containing protein n=1 Tax=Actinoallomurus spadix TaxID=79912 RepID=A0ABN0VU80_9ACTN|nr:methyltransferase domain-containing protein [Actinoallomurus spadix]MCO5985695.1 methyltransferase domain-containing protein [Actinoallomurus spadix]